VHTIHELYLARLALGVAEGCIWPVCSTYARRWFPAREHGRIQSLWVNGNQVGIALGLPIVSVLISAAGWRSVFTVLTAASLLLLEPLLLFFAPDDPELSPHANQQEREYIRTNRAVSIGSRTDAPRHWTSLAANRNLWILAGCQTGTVATLFGLTAWIPTYLIQARGLAFDALKSWVAASYLLPIAVAMALGFVADRTMRPAAVGAASSGVVAVLVLASVVVHSTVISVLLLVTTLAAPMIYAAMNVSIVQGLVPLEQVGRATGLFVGLGNLVGGLAPTIIGYLISHFGGRYLAAFGFVSAVDLGLIALYLAIDRAFANQASATQIQMA
jgi:sugar phosphate permease